MPKTDNRALRGDEEACTIEARFTIDKNAGAKRIIEQGGNQQRRSAREIANTVLLSSIISRVAFRIEYFRVQKRSKQINLDATAFNILKNSAPDMVRQDNSLIDLRIVKFIEDTKGHARENDSNALKEALQMNQGAFVLSIVENQRDLFVDLGKQIIEELAPIFAVFVGQKELKHVFLRRIQGQKIGQEVLHGE